MSFFPRQQSAAIIQKVSLPLVIFFSHLSAPRNREKGGNTSCKRDFTWCGSSSVRKYWLFWHFWLILIGPSDLRIFNARSQNWTASGTTWKIFCFYLFIIPTILQQKVLHNVWISIQTVRRQKIDSNILNIYLLLFH